MQQQPMFSEFGPHRKPLDRLFFAIRATPAVVARVTDMSRRLRRANGLKGRPIPPGCLHVSLHGLGDYSALPDMIVEAAKAAGGSVRLPPVEVSFDRAMSFAGNGEKRAFVLRAGGDMAGLTTLHRTLGAAMKRAGLGQWVAPGFTPHMTLLYDEQIVEDRPIGAIRWTARDFVLIHSLLGQTRHMELARWPLRG
jgi:RNA 2',3'-cyclic 3'-phosphodiesterase